MIRFIFLCAFMSVFAAQTVKAQQFMASDTSVPVAFSADEMVYNREIETVTARGNVEIIQSGKILRADTVNYNLKDNIVTASGNIVLSQPDGTVIFSDYTELRDDLKDGAIKNIRMILSDKSRMAAMKAQRVEGKKNLLENAVYSPCDVCTGKKPLWQVKALRVIHDQEKKDVIYNDAWLEMWGVPVIYTPYLSHPDPQVKRRSGFLVPNFGGTKNLGASVQIPYFWDISPEKDITLSPIFTSDEGGVFVGEYRAIYDNSAVNLAGSFTKDSKGELRSHIDSEARIDFDETWRFKTTVQRSSDDTYMRRYGFEEDNSPWLTVDGNLEGFGRRNYASVKGYSFQDLREDANDDDTPLVVPVMDYNYIGEPGKHGDYWTLDTNTMSLSRRTGQESQRASLTGGWHLPYTSRNGELYNLTASVRGDAYYVNNVPREQESNYDGFTGRIHPQLAMEWRYPLVRKEEASQQVIEPVIVGVVSPNGNNSEKIPNEDSRDLEFDDTNVLTRNRFVGFDRVETGPRVNYGLLWSIYGLETGQASAFLGQSYRFVKDSVFPEESGLEKRLSDYVGRIFASPSDELELMYRFRLDRNGLVARRNEVNLTAGSDVLRFSSDYMFINASDYKFTGFDDREELGTAISSKLSKYWSIGVNNRHDLTDGGGHLNFGGYVAYEDECARFETTVDRSYTHDRDYDNGYSIMFTITLKPVGELKTGRQRL